MISIKIRRERTWENGENSGLNITRRGGARCWKPSATRAAGSPVQVWEWLRAALVRKAISNPRSEAQVYNKGQQMLGTVQRPCLLWLCRIRRFGKTGCCQLVIYSFAEKYNKSTSTDQKSLWFAVFVCFCWPAQLPTTAQRDHKNLLYCSSLAFCPKMELSSLLLVIVSHWMLYYSPHCFLMMVFCKLDGLWTQLPVGSECV